MKMVKGGAIAFVMALVAMAHVVVKPSEGCMDIAPSVVMCAPYAMGTVAQPSVGCCNELRRLDAMALTMLDRRRICFCFKQVAPQYPNVKDDALALLPLRCGVSLPFSVSRNMDCNIIQ